MASSTLGTLLKVGLVGGGAYLLYEYFFATPAAATAPAGSTTAGTTTTTTGTTPPAATSAYNTLAAIFARISAVAPASASPDQYNAIFNAQGGQQAIGGGSLPDPVSVFGSHDNLTLAQWWAGTSAWLAQNKGLTGLGVYAGLGALAFGRRRGRF